MAGDAGARGATYDIEVSADGSDWQKVVSNATIPSGGENEFNDHEFDIQPARHVRYKGITNGGWDHNFAEFEVYGIGLYDPEGSDELSGVFVTPASSVNYAGDALSLSAIATSGKGVKIPDATIAWSVEPADGATIGADGVFTATATGTYTVTASATVGGVSKEGKATVEVREARKPMSVTLSRVKENSVGSNWSDVFLTGEAVKFALEIRDQYDGLYPGASVTYDLDGGTLDEAAKAVAWGEAGTKTLKVTAGSATASFTVEIVDAEALTEGLTATASSENVEANMTADKAVDSDPGSRWASQGTEAGVAQEEFLIVNLGEAKKVAAIGVAWEGACAAEYTIEVSADGENYTQLGGETRELGIVNHLYRVKGIGDEAIQFIKVACAVPATNYGYSIFEVTPYVTSEEPVTPPTSISTAKVNGSGMTVSAEGEIRFTEEMKSVKIFSLAGSLVKSARNTSAVSAGSLAEGVYVVKTTDKDGVTSTAKVTIR